MLKTAIQSGQGIRSCLISLVGLLPPSFVGLLFEGRSRALVIIAHFFSTVPNVWWARGAGGRVIHHIWESLDPEWKQWKEYLDTAC